MWYKDCDIKTVIENVKYMYPNNHLYLGVRFHIIRESKLHINGMVADCICVFCAITICNIRTSLPLLKYVSIMHFFAISETHFIIKKRT